MELSLPLVRVPFEGASRSFRLMHKQLTRELAQAAAQIEALDDGDAQQPGHRMDAEAAIARLGELAATLQQLKHSAKSSALQQQRDLESCATRAQYLEELEAAKIGRDPSAPSLHERTSPEQAINDRLIADYLLRQGYLESAKIVEDTKDVAYLVDHELHAECQAVLKNLQAHQTAKAIAWCSQNGSRLRRLQSQVEFHLRLQDFIEFVRARKPLDAVQYARTYLTPLAMQPEKQALRDSAIGEVQVAMATLAYEAPEKCGIEAYEKVFSMDRWLVLEKMFLKTFNDVYGMHDPPSLCIALHAGLSTLNTRACHLARDANLKARLARSGARGKRPRREGDEGTGATADDGKDSGNESDEVWFKPSSKGDGSTSPSQSTNNSPGSKKRKHCHTDSPVPICPACSEVGSQLCTGLPFAYHPHSRLVCRVTQSAMDEHNPPLVLPNGRVYSKRGIELLTQRSTDGMIKCMDTHDVFSPTDVKPVYIL
ncbi:Macrophage erythroblast attacher [Phytophthora cinnamomi]|uniref:Macrophage erythroblast attacher n=1 Tax=Phytophthora cinnamomi TaxID=4785 RepID=UPI00355A09E8|nr:Macrophage erythroblast attacher [Phytophthora cinnamomi]